MGSNCTQGCLEACLPLIEDPPAYGACFALCVIGCASMDP